MSHYSAVVILLNANLNPDHKRVEHKIPARGAIYCRKEKSAVCSVVLHCNAMERNEKGLFIFSPTLHGPIQASALTSRASSSLNLNASGFPSLPLGYCSEVYGVVLLYEVSLGVSLNT